MVLDIDLDTIVTTIMISGGFCFLVVLLWCIVADREMESDRWLKNPEVGSQQEREVQEAGQQAAIDHAADKGMTDEKMLNPAYRMTLIGPDMQRQEPLKVSRHGSEHHARHDEGHRDHHAVGKDAFEGEGR